MTTGVYPRRNAREKAEAYALNLQEKWDLEENYRAPPGALLKDVSTIKVFRCRWRRAHRSGPCCWGRRIYGCRTRSQWFKKRLRVTLRVVCLRLIEIVGASRGLSIWIKDLEPRIEAHSRQAGWEARYLGGFWWRVTPTPTFSSAQLTARFRGVFGARRQSRPRARAGWGSPSNSSFHGFSMHILS